MFSWVFLGGRGIVLRGFDVLVGLCLFFIGLFLFGYFGLVYVFLVYVFLIFFMRWFSSGGSSYLSGAVRGFIWDYGWMEVAGGQGVWRLLVWRGEILGLVRWVMLGFVLLFFLFLVVFLV